ncbi:MAG: hypothetical protein ACTHJ1_13810 [Bordetella sp.]|uniref:hypothetical protein n=1 Tax=Bordetella sp. TaxID=28081 RepID=UPI003F7CCDAB
MAFAIVGIAISADPIRRRNPEFAFSLRSASVMIAATPHRKSPGGEELRFSFP